jgi:hypothetical protein
MSALKRTNEKVTLFKHRPSGDVLLRGEDGRWLPDVLAGVERRLADHAVSQHLDHLSLNCKRDDLLDTLVWIGPYAEIEDSQAALVGFPRAKLKTVLKRMRRCAEDVDILLGLGHTESLLSGGPASPLEKELPWVPTNLLLYADYVEGIMDDSSLHPRSHFTRNIGISHLIAYVKVATSRFCDKEVSALISAILDRPDYDEQAHRQWRAEHRGLISQSEKYFEARANGVRRGSSTAGPNLDGNNT